MFRFISAMAEEILMKVCRHDLWMPGYDKKKILSYQKLPLWWGKKGLKFPIIRKPEKCW